MGDITVRIVAESEEFKTLKGVWDGLLRKCGSDKSIYLTHEWQSTWWKHFGAGKKLNILLIEKEKQVIGIIPLVKVRYGIGLIGVDTLETIGSVNSNYVWLVTPDNREEVMSALLAYLGEELDRNKVLLMLTYIPESSKFLNLLRRNGNPFSRNTIIRERVMTLAPYIPLPATWDEYFASLSQNRRYIINRAMRALSEEGHRVQLQQYGADSMDAALSKLFAFHRRRWESLNIPSAFSDSRIREFYGEIARQFLGKNWLYFSCLTVDDEIVSTNYYFVYNRKLYACITARDTEYSDYGIGHLHRALAIKDAIEKHLQEYDFLKGDEPYKFYWTKSARRYIEVIMLKKGFWHGLRLRFLHVIMRLGCIKHYGLRGIFSQYQINRREREERKKMRPKISLIP
ncbi:GNAT family N-acetyltransferase [Chloroflexota bacterium]